MCAMSLQSCPTLCNTMDCSPPGSSVSRIVQARILECVAMPSSRGSCRPRDQTWLSCITGSFLHSVGFFTHWPTRETVHNAITVLVYAEINKHSNYILCLFVLVYAALAGESPFKITLESFLTQPYWFLLAFLLTEKLILYTFSCFQPMNFIGIFEKMKWYI